MTHILKKVLIKQGWSCTGKFFLNVVCKSSQLLIHACLYCFLWLHWHLWDGRSIVLIHLLGLVSNWNYFLTSEWNDKDCENLGSHGLDSGGLKTDSPARLQGLLDSHEQSAPGADVEANFFPRSCSIKEILVARDLWALTLSGSLSSIFNASIKAWSHFWIAALLRLSEFKCLKLSW